MVDRKRETKARPQSGPLLTAKPLQRPDATISKRKSVEDALKRRKDLYQLLAENVTDVIWVGDLHANLAYVSPSVIRQSGFTVEEIMADPAKVINKKAFELALRAYREQLKHDEEHGPDEEPNPMELEVSHKDGHKIWTETHWSLLRDKDGPPVGIIGIVRDITERKRYEEALKRSESELRRLSQRVLQIQEDERARIARDLHDQLGQELAYLRIKAESLLQQLGDSSDAHEPMLELLSLIDQIRATSRRIAVSISPPILDDLGLLKAVRLCAGEFARRASIPCFVDAPTDNRGVPKEVATAAYRILQESLTNVWKHAKASEVYVNVDMTRNNLVLRISDNGVGFDGKILDDSSLGLVSMRERAHLVGGSVRVTKGRSGGTQVEARLPLDGSSSGDKRQRDRSLRSKAIPDEV